MTRAASMGPVADLLRRCGVAPDPLFRRHGLSTRLSDEGERLILLRDQLALVETAARAAGDDIFGARLSAEVGIGGLGEFGRHVGSAATLGAAIVRTNATMVSHLQSATRIRLERTGGSARWTYLVTERVEAGRTQNELLALGYQLDLMRRFLGPRWQPTRVELPAAARSSRVRAAAVFGCDVALGATTAVTFPAHLLEHPNPTPMLPMSPPDAAVPDLEDVIGCVQHLLASTALDRRPTLPDLARRLGLGPRTLQRRLAAQGETFDSLLARSLRRRAVELLSRGHSVTAVGVELGYSDTAHFTRAYRSWTGRPPSADRSPPAGG
jgi:AraC-like DNA-binding protein